MKILNFRRLISSTTKINPSSTFKSSNSIHLQSNSSNSSKPKRPIYLRFANNPSELNIRIQHLSKISNGGLDKAIELVRQSSIQVATVSVWTQLLQLITRARRFSLVYRVFLDLKQRQIQPDTQFFVSFFAALANSPKSKNVTLDRLKSIWSQAHHSNQISSSNHTKQLPIQLTNAYLNSLCSHGFIDETFELLKKLPSDSIDSITISQVLKSLNPTHDHLNLTRDLLNQSNLLEKFDLRAILTIASLFLKSTHQNHQQFGAKLIHDKIGIQVDTIKENYRFWAKSHGPLPKPNQATLRFDSGELTTLLRILLKLQKFSLIRRLWDQIIKNRDLYLHRDSIDQIHCGLVMVALGQCGRIDEVESLLQWMIESKSYKLLPISDTLDKAMQAAWQAEDLTAAIRILTLLSQQRKDLVDPPASQEKKSTTNSILSTGPAQFKAIWPSNRALSTLLQTAGNSGKTSEIDQAFRLVEQFNRRLPEKRPHCATSPQNPSSCLPSLPIDKSVELYWQRQYIWVLTDLLDRMIRRPEKSLSSDRRAALEEWRTQIDEELEKEGNLEMRMKIENRAEEQRLRREAAAERKKAKNQ
ncbi:hypothetical protein O181_023532 [Austropuccinia psidii MF-1]|uniref:Pentatricopeptide repeat-containing protein n=1 Tax=Austropuccinia psidii MF-1 TaxID=1389203 RepID=A0A9Q3CHJ4_9BASI|nr:hypothetical protein [Austropuccinia psidii MF-1]